LGSTANMSWTSKVQELNVTSEVYIYELFSSVDLLQRECSDSDKDSHNRGCHS